MNNFRFALRMLWKSPRFTAVAVLTLALGIGVNTSIFSVVNTLMLRPLPYPEPDRLLRVFSATPQLKGGSHSVANFLDYRQQNSVFESIAGFTWWRFSLLEPGAPAENLRGLLVTADFLAALGVRPALGRLFHPDEDQPGRNQVLILSHACWTRKFANAPDILGRRLRIDGESVTVVGVMPPTFDYPLLWDIVDAWRPVAFTPAQREDRGNAWLNLVARLKPGVSQAQAEAAMRVVAARLSEAHPEHNAQRTLHLGLLRHAIGDSASRRLAWLMLGLTGFVLLIACVNLANLQLARAVLRSRELAVRLALGVGRWRLMGLMLWESLLIALLGGALGVVIANETAGFIGRQLTRWSPEGIAVAPDGRVLWFALASAVLTGLIFGAAPAWFASRTNLNEVLKSGGRGSTAGHSQNRLRHALIVGEIAMALVLLTGAGLLIAGLERFIRHEPGWRIDGLWSGRVMQSSRLYASADQRRAFAERLEARLSTVVGVQRAGLCLSLPVWVFGTSHRFRLADREAPRLGQEPLGQLQIVSPGYFDTLGIRLRQGRSFTATDTVDRPEVVIINEAMARQFWPDENPLGKRIALGEETPPRWQEIVGVVNDVRFPANLSRPDTPWQIYRPLAQQPPGLLTLSLRVGGAPPNFVARVRQAVAELDSDLPVSDLEPVRQYVDRQFAHITLAGAFLVVFAVLGMILAALGIYGVVSYLVVQRTAEIGIRVALGAQRRDVTWLVLRRGLLLSIAGVLAGLGGAFVVERLLAAAAPELPVRDPLVFAGVALILVLVSMFASWLPARRAAKVDPIIALRCD